MTIPWNEASERTKQRYTLEAKQVVFAVLDEIAPECPEMLLSALRADDQGDETVDNSLMEALVECYNNTVHWSTKGRSCP